MGATDDFIRAQAQHVLHPGEQPTGFAFVRSPQRFTIIGVPEDSSYEDYLAVMTPTRLILFRSSSTMFGQPKLEVRGEPIVWLYDEIESVKVGDVAGITNAAHFFTLKPYAGMGPLRGKLERYDLANNANGIDGQTQACRTYGPWLAQQIAAGAFRMAPQKWAAKQAELATRAQAQQAAAAQAAAEAAQRSREMNEALKRAMPTMMRVAVGIGIFLVFAVFALVSANYVRQNVGWEFARMDADLARAETDVATSRAGQPPVAGCTPPQPCRQCKYGTASSSSSEKFYPDGTKALYGNQPQGWTCPNTAYYESAVAREKEMRAKVDTDIQMNWVKAVVFAFIALLVLAAGGGVLVWDRKRAARAKVAPAGAVPQVAR